MTNVEAIKVLYVALGGDLTDTYDDIANGEAVGNYTVTSDVILALAKIAGGAGIELPEVTAADNGKVLKVIEGKWGVGDDEITA